MIFFFAGIYFFPRAFSVFSFDPGLQGDEAICFVPSDDYRQETVYI
jgi:hypothetical protein